MNSFLGPFHQGYKVDASSNSINNMITCNIFSVIKMTSIVLPRMINNGKGGVIVNVSSIGGTFAVPTATVYSSTKAAVDFFSK
jgi:17beta-estradiol 17-dehydrogenase / very-long-chain 3-oxoacyl-CoA reductase